MDELRLALEQALSALPPDPAGPPLFQPLVAPPPHVPRVLAADAGVEELLTLLAPAPARTPPGGGAAPRTPFSSAPPAAKRKTNPERTMDEAPTPRPYTMPDLREARRRMNSLPPGGLAASDEVPDYIDQSTLASSAPRLLSEGGAVVIGSGGATPAPAKEAKHPPAEKDKKEKKKRDKAKSDPPARAPAEAAQGAPTTDVPRIRVGLLAAVFVAMMLVGGTMAFSYSTKSKASVVRRDAGVAVVNQVLQLQGLVDDLAGEGADRERLAEAWFRFQDARPQERAATAIEFARLSVSEAQRVGAHGKAGTQVHHLQTKLEAYEAADERWTEATTSGLGRLTGSMGSF
jgi:hypothetical protein